MGSRLPFRKSLHFSPVLGEFCFKICPLHPPSILPISIIFIDNAAYFLFSSDLVSQRIIKSIFNVSTFRIARRIYGCFSWRAKKAAIDIASIVSIKSVSIR